MGHVTRCFVAGIVALLPVGGTILGIALLEGTIRDALFRNAGFYFPGLGILAAAAAIYLVGLAVTTFVGRYLWRTVDRVLDSLPALGLLYRSLKQILGYGEGRDALFVEAVVVPCTDIGGEQLGLVTSRVTDAEGREKQLVFVPGAPNPTTGRLVMVDPGSCRSLGVPVHEVLKLLVSVGKTAPEFAAARSTRREH